MTPTSFFFTPIWRQPQIPMMLLYFTTLLVQALFISYWDYYNLLIWFTCGSLHSQFNQRDKYLKYSLIFKSSHWLWNKISFHNVLYMSPSIFLHLQPLALSLKTPLAWNFFVLMYQHHVFFLPSLESWLLLLFGMPIFLSLSIINCS